MRIRDFSGGVAGRAERKQAVGCFVAGGGQSVTSDAGDFFSLADLLFFLPGHQSTRGEILVLQAISQRQQAALRL